ncbi:LapA family protein [Bradyrhizobium sp. WSM 1704]|uniref:lipopolysaccharide assembly protein LapA domain-containing protein n=1 Tax=Bradyrhizobium semiaridum TaxID=2821404 RepID=UPI001CE309CA|nr:LapA family protein [Bradyrhizobium semiaridum]MCA6126275.1 LapA family protein [Bradyrhizobium semiaridum]
MRKFFTAVVLVPLGLIFIIFAVANRHWVTVSFDPFNSVTPTVAVTLPLFVVIIASAILGVIAGGVTTWLRQGRWRRAARRSEADARLARAEIAGIRAAATRDHAQRRPAPAQLGFYGSAGRDKQGATL